MKVNKMTKNNKKNKTKERRPQITLTPGEKDTRCRKISRLRIKGLSYAKVSEYMDISVSWIERNYPQWCARQFDIKKAEWKKYVDEFIERQEDVIMISETTGDQKTKEKANVNLFDRLQAAGAIPKSLEKIEHSGEIKISAKDLIAEIKRRKQEKQNKEKEDNDENES